MNVYLGLFLVGVLCVLPAEGFAQKLKDQFTKPMPKVQLMPEAEFVKMTQKLDIPSEIDPALAYQIRIPKDWKSVPEFSAKSGVADLNILGEIGRFSSPAGMDVPSFIQVNAIVLDYQTTVEQWYLKYLLTGGYSVQGFKIYNETCGEALHVDTKDTISYVVRSVACINGKNLIFVEYYLPLEQWDDYKGLQAQVLNSFRLKQIVRAYVEDLSEERLLDIVAFRFPVSWKANPYPIESIDRMKIEFLNISTVPQGYDLESRLDGTIDVDVVSVEAAKTLEEEIARNKSSFNKSTLFVGDQIEKSIDLVFNTSLDFADTNVYKFVDSKNKYIQYELWQTAIGAADYYYFVSLVTPSRDQNYSLWARNTQTYRLFMDLIKPNPGIKSKSDKAVIPEPALAPKKL